MISLLLGIHCETALGFGLYFKPNRFMCTCYIFPPLRTPEKKNSHSFFQIKLILEGKICEKSGNRHHMHAAALHYESKKILAKLISQHRLAQNTGCFFLLSSFSVPPCSRGEQTTVCDRDTDMVIPGSHRSVGTPCRSAVQLAYPSVSL